MRKLSAGLLLLLWLASPALAQSTFTMPPPAGVQVMGVQVVTTCGAASLTNNAVAFVAMNTAGSLCTNAAGSSTAVQGNAGTNAQAWWVRIGDTTNGPVAVKPPSTAALATDPALVMQLTPNSPGVIALGPAAVASSIPFTLSSQYPTNAVTTTPIAITGNATGTTGAVVGTLAAASGKTTFICGFSISATGGVATLGPIVVAGLVGSSQTYQLFSTATGANLVIPFSPCIPASAVNTAITITTTADATAAAVDVNSWGYQL